MRTNRVIGKVTSSTESLLILGRQADFVQQA